MPTPVNAKLVELVKSETAAGVDGSSAAGRKAAKYSGEELAEAVGVIVPVDYASWALAVAVASVVTYRLLSAGV